MERQAEFDRLMAELEADHVEWRAAFGKLASLDMAARAAVFERLAGGGWKPGQGVTTAAIKAALGETS